MPLTPLVEVIGKVTGVASTQYSKVDAKLNSGVRFSCTVTETVILPSPITHSPAFGVKVYVFVPDTAVEISEGVHVPLTPLMEVVGKVIGIAPTQYSKVDAKLNSGVRFSCTVTVTALRALALPSQ